MQINTNELIQKYKSFFKGGGYYYSDPKKPKRKKMEAYDGVLLKLMVI